ncbi:MAG: LLM class F420-dependent oxidoreductase [Acidimicrobiales bacterium]
MQIGVIYPQTELPLDPDVVRAYIERVEDLGFRHVVVYDHVLGADRVSHPDFEGPYDLGDTFHEPFVLYGFIAAFSRLQLVTGIIVAPQRQTALLAKQAAEVDILSAGRLRLGIGIGWNSVEYEALGQDFTTRGAREEEQIGLLRRLWTEQSVTYEGRFDRITGAGLSPPPLQRPIPIWLGGNSRAAYERMGRLADGWFPQVPPGASLDEAKEIVARAAEGAGRDIADIGMEGKVRQGAGGPGALLDEVEAWRDAGASHVSIDTLGAHLADLDAHLDVLAVAADALQPDAPRLS